MSFLYHSGSNFPIEVQRMTTSLLRTAVKQLSLLKQPSSIEGSQIIKGNVLTSSFSELGFRLAYEIHFSTEQLS